MVYRRVAFVVMDAEHNLDEFNHAGGRKAEHGDGKNFFLDIGGVDKQTRAGNPKDQILPAFSFQKYAVNKKERSQNRNIQRGKLHSRPGGKIGEVREDEIHRCS